MVRIGIDIRKFLFIDEALSKMLILANNEDIDQGIMYLNSDSSENWNKISASRIYI